jgi:hypothetical protein
LIVMFADCRAGAHALPAGTLDAAGTPAVAANAARSSDPVLATDGSVTGSRELADVALLEEMPDKNPSGTGGSEGSRARYCAMLADSSLWCWDDPRANAPPSGRLPAGTVQIASAGCMTCGRTSDGHVACLNPNETDRAAQTIAVSGATDIAVGAFSSPVGCAAGYAATNDRHVVVWLSDNGLGQVTDVSFSAPIVRIAADGFLSFCVLLEGATVDCSWNLDFSLRANVHVEGKPEAGALPYLHGAYDIFVNGLCVYGQMGHDVVREECVGKRVMQPDGEHVTFHPTRKELPAPAGWWERARLGHDPTLPVEPRCSLRPDRKVECTGAGLGKPLVVGRDDTAIGSP